MAALSVLAATKPNQTKPNQRMPKIHSEKRRKKGNSARWMRWLWPYIKRRKSKAATGHWGRGRERGSTARWSEIFAGELVSGKYLRYFHLATEWFMTPCSLYSCCCCCCWCWCCWCCRHLANPNTKRHRSWVFASFAAG